MTVLPRIVARVMFLLLLLGEFEAIASFYLSPWGFVILAIVIAPALWALGGLALLSSGEGKAALGFASWPVWFAVGLIVSSLFGEDEALATFVLGTVALNVAVIYSTHLVLGRPVAVGAERVN